MSSRMPTPWLDEVAAAYISSRLPSPDPVQAALIEATSAIGPVARMQISSEQGALMELLVHVTGARRIVEVGTFTGYSALCLARAAGPEGRLTCCDVSEEWTAIGRRHWEQAGVADRIDLRLAPALDTLRSLPVDDPIDMAFIDADKGNYLNYLQELIPRMRPNGLVIVDNTLWSGRVLEPAAEGDTDTVALQHFNDTVAADPRLDSVILPVGDGVTLIRIR